MEENIVDDFGSLTREQLAQIVGLLVRELGKVVSHKEWHDGGEEFTLVDMPISDKAT